MTGTLLSLNDCICENYTKTNQSNSCLDHGETPEAPPLVYELLSEMIAQEGRVGFLVVSTFLKVTQLPHVILSI